MFEDGDDVLKRLSDALHTFETMHLGGGVLTRPQRPVPPADDYADGRESFSSGVAHVSDVR